MLKNSNPKHGTATSNHASNNVPIHTLGLGGVHFNNYSGVMMGFKFFKQSNRNRVVV